jgi:hypothetical protein
MSCEEKAQLARAYHAAISKFMEAVGVLQRNIQTPAGAEFTRLRGISDEERLQTEGARLALQQHMEAHNC